MIKAVTLFTPKSKNNTTFKGYRIKSYEEIKKIDTDAPKYIPISNRIIINNQKILDQKLDMNRKINLAILESLSDISTAALDIEKRLNQLKNEEKDLFNK